MGAIAQDGFTCAIFHRDGGVGARRRRRPSHPVLSRAPRPVGGALDDRPLGVAPAAVLSSWVKLKTLAIAAVAHGCMAWRTTATRARWPRQLRAWRADFDFGAATGRAGPAGGEVSAFGGVPPRARLINSVSGGFSVGTRLLPEHFGAEGSSQSGDHNEPC